MTVPTASDLSEVPEEALPDDMGEEPRRRRFSPGRIALFGVVGATIAIVLAVAPGLIFPAYQWPTSASYGTRLGYPALLRHLGKPIPVKTALAERRRLVKSELG